MVKSRVARIDGETSSSFGKWTMTGPIPRGSNQGCATFFSRTGAWQTGRSCKDVKNDTEETFVGTADSSTRDSTDDSRGPSVMDKSDWIGRVSKAAEQAGVRR